MREIAVAGRPAFDRSMLARGVGLLIAHPIGAIFALALVTRLVVALFLSGFFSGSLVYDDTTYHLMAKVAAEGATVQWDEFTHTLYWATATLLIPVTLLYKIFGPQMVVAQLFVVVLGTAAAVATTKLALEFLETRWALLASGIVALLPSQALWSSLLMKDAAVWVLLSALAVVVAVAGRSSGRRLLLMGILALLLLVLLSFLRLHTLVVASWAMMLGAVAGNKLARVPRIVGAVAIGVLVPWLAGQIGPAGLSLVTDHGSLEDRRFANAFGANTAIVETAPVPRPGVTDGFLVTKPVGNLQEEVAKLESKSAVLTARAEEIVAVDPARANKLRERAEVLVEKQERLLERQAAIANVVPPPDTPSPDEALLDPNIRHLPRGLSVMLIEPFPVPFTGSIALRLARLESVLWYPIVILALIGLWQARRHMRTLAFPLLTGGGILLTYALAEGNIGTAHRHRGEFVWVVAVLAGLGAATLWRRYASPQRASG